MKICVYGSASNRIDEKYIKDGENLGKVLAEHGHTLVYGAGSEGLMGAVARGFHAGGSTVHGVIPKFFEENGYEALYYESDKLTYTETMAERKQIMEDECEAFVITPGGIGTFEEFFQALTLKQLGRHKKAIAVFNSYGYYNELLALLNGAIEKGFINRECAELIKAFSSATELCEYLENYSEKDYIDWSKLKRN